MAERGKPRIPLQGPFGGVSCLPARWESGRRSPLAVNCDSRGGTIRPRSGYSVFKAFNDCTVCGLHAWDAPDGTPLVAALLWDATNWTTSFAVLRADGSYAVLVDMAHGSLGLGLPPDHNPWWSSLDVEGVLWFTTPQGILHYYRWPEEQPRIATEGTASIHQDTFAYLDAPPHGRILALHEDALVLADMDTTAWCHAQSEPDTNSPDYDPNIWTQLEVSRRYAQSELAISDTGPRYNRLNFCSETSVIARVGSGPVTAVASTPFGLLVFKRGGVYRMEWNLSSLGGAVTQASVRWDTVLEGPGAVNHRVVAQGAGIIAWLGHDGVYAMTTGGQPLGRAGNISDDIGQLWTQEGWKARPVPQVAGVFDNAAYPWRIAKSHVDRAVGTWNPVDQTFWWSVPLSGETDTRRLNALTLVWSPITQEWDIYAPKRQNSAAYSTLAPTAFCSYFDGNRHRFLFGNGDSQICEWGESPCDKQPNGDEHGIGAAWQSMRLSMEDPDEVFSADRARLAVTAIASGGNALQLNVEGERSFDLDDARALSGVVAVPKRPSVDELGGAGTAEYQWSGGNWGEFQWHEAGVWRTFCPLNENLVGSHIIVAFTLVQLVDDGPEVHSLTIECTPRRVV